MFKYVNEKHQCYSVSAALRKINKGRDLAEIPTFAVIKRDVMAKLDKNQQPVPPMPEKPVPPPFDGEPGAGDKMPMRR